MLHLLLAKFQSRLMHSYRRAFSVADILFSLYTGRKKPLLIWKYRQDQERQEWIARRREESRSEPPSLERQRDRTIFSQQLNGLAPNLETQRQRQVDCNENDVAHEEQFGSIQRIVVNKRQPELAKLRNVIADHLQVKVMLCADGRHGSKQRG